MDVGALAAVVLGAVLATASGIGTELWKRRRETRAAARLVWFELLIGYTDLLGVVAQEKWPDEFAPPDEAWKAQRDRLALGLKAQVFTDLQGVYIGLDVLAEMSPTQRGEPVLYWPLLASLHRTVLALGESANIERAELDNFRMPVEDSLVQLRTTLTEMRALPEAGRGGLIDDAIAQALESFPPELRAQAEKAVARQRRAASRATSRHVRPSPA